MRIHILSAKPGIGTGYSTVVQNLAPELKKLGHDVAITGFQQAYRMEEYKGIPVYPLLDDFHAAGDINVQIHRLALNLKTHQSDVLLCLFQGDSMYNPFTQVHQNTVFYCPIEGEIIYKNHPTFKTARNVKKVVSMTNSAGAQFRKHGIENTTIYHGYNPKIFRKGISATDETIMIYFPASNEELSIPVRSLAELKEKMGWRCVYGFNGLNFGVRKRIERLIEAFAFFARYKDDVHLHLHTPPIHPKGLNLLEILEYYKIKNHVTFSYSGIGTSGVSDRAVSALYNFMDVHASASSGEGFGLATLESMACGIPQIAPDVDPFREFFGQDDDQAEPASAERGLLANSTPQLTPAGEIRGLVDARDLAEKMEALYWSDARKRIGANAERWARQFTWDKIAQQFDAVFRS